MPYARKTDSTQSEIVKGLRKCGYRVEIIGKPVDLLVLVGKNYWRLLEVKNRKRNDQPKQRAFCRETDTPVVGSVEEALEALVR
jgi:hypothetical protein